MKGWQRILLLIIPYFFVVGVFQFTGFLLAGVNFRDLEAEKTSGQHLILVIWIFWNSYSTMGFYEIY